MLGHSAVVEVCFTHDHDPSLNSLAFSLPMKPPRSYAYVWNRIGSRTPSMDKSGWGDGENRAHTHSHTKENAYMQSHDTQQQRFIMQPELQDIRSPASSNWFLMQQQHGNGPPSTIVSPPPSLPTEKAQFRQATACEPDFRVSSQSGQSVVPVRERCIARNEKK
jgi:hypothetical protein